MKTSMSLEQYRSRYVQPELVSDDLFKGARSARLTEQFDAMSPGLRECVNEFGPQIVNEITQAGVSSPQKIRTIVKACWLGARQFGQRTKPADGGSPVAAQVDWLLIQSGSSLSATTLARVLWENGMVIMPRMNHQGVMVDASMSAIDGMGRLDKRQKHAARLEAAIEAGARKYWPSLFGGSK